MKKIFSLVFAPAFLLSACSSTPLTSKKAFPGCEWNLVSGLGIEFVSQSCSKGEVFAEIKESSDGKGFVISGNSGDNAYRSVTVLENKNNLSSSDIMKVNTPDGCESWELSSEGLEGVSRFQVRPLLKDVKDVAPLPCGEMGISRLGTYFEFHEGKSKFLLVSPGEGASIFDRDSFKIID